MSDRCSTAITGSLQTMQQDMIGECRERSSEARPQRRLSYLSVTFYDESTRCLQVLGDVMSSFHT